MRDDAEAILCELLVLRCRRGDPAAWRQLITLFERRLMYYLRRLIDAERDAWDVLQQTWMEAYKGLHRLAEPRALRTWLFRIAHCQAVSHLRRNSREPAAVADDNPADPAQALAEPAANADPFAAAEAAEQVHAGLARLTLPHREVLTLHFLEDLPVEEISLVLDVPPGTVKSRLHYAKRALREVLEREETQ